jgi:hypothetical protein
MRLMVNLLNNIEDAIQIQQCCHICLLNVSFKIFTKVDTNGISEVASKVVRPTQMALMSWPKYFGGSCSPS